MFGATTFVITTLSIKTFSLITLSINGLIATLSINGRTTHALLC